MKRALFGGSFDPFHKGHLGMVETLLSKEVADQVIVMPCQQSPHKLNHAYTEGEHRLEMVKIAVQDSVNAESIEVSDYELLNKEVSFTYQTLDYLKALYPEDEISLVIGADQWASFPRWTEYERIQANHEIIVFGRATEFDLDFSGVTFVEFDNASASTQIRKGEQWDEMLTPAVIRYIKGHQLYRR